MAGIKETKEMVVFGVSLGNALDNTLSDGFQWTDPISWVPPLTKLPGAIEGLEEISTETDDMDEAERKELIDEVLKLDFDSDYSEEIAEQGLRVGLEMAKLVLILRRAKKAAA